MGIGEIINQTASEVYRSPSGVVSIANAHSTPPSGTVLNPAHNRTKLPPLGGGHPPPFRKIFSDRNYTRYIYIGNTRYATREELERNHTEDARYINEQLANRITLTQTPPPEETTSASTPPSPSSPPPPPPSNSTEGQYLRRNNPDPHPDPHHPSWGGGTPLERLLFKGPRHMKRGSGISKINTKAIQFAYKPKK